MPTNSFVAEFKQVIILIDGGASDVRLALLLLAQDKKREIDYKSNDTEGFSFPLILFKIDCGFYPSITFDTPPKLNKNKKSLAELNQQAIIIL